MMDAFTDETVAADLRAVRDRISAVTRPFNHPVEVLPVTKGFDGRAVEAAHAAGCRAVGENYAQDLLGKAGVIDALGMSVHFIGRLQSNKIRQIASLVTVWESVDRASILREIAKRSAGARVLLQVNATDEPNKGGCALSDVRELVDLAQELGVRVDGLMTVGPTGKPAESARPAFRAVRGLVDELGLAICSMGMTADLEVAVQEGATQVRVGSALFGQRPTKPEAPQGTVGGTDR